MGNHGAPRAAGMPQPRSDGYASKIIKAGALLDDTKTLLAAWDAGASVPERVYEKSEQPYNSA